MLKLLTRSSVSRFLISGGFNTAATYALYLLLLNILSYRISYSIAFVTGVVLAYVLNRTFVFKSHRGLKSVLWMPLVYLGQYLVGMLVLWLWVELLELPHQAAPLVAILITLPLNYLISRFAFTKRQRKFKHS
ncbi:GtrA family protein [Pseudomonas sp. 148P]|uniref:GtrA family protein n=1 Tax=Pseudomonas ulcerans TaxID=3115852 RepID=A0ABU7HPT6_9PSED|nr:MULTISPECIES: GtrA family protein [unclassified Pseudomonas]MEE1921968.1 GtrA family protein [Pseudomonas sp. 147P]MEE1933552.1 GtrA family protein [Pseudomonas sp. 148P]